MRILVVEDDAETAAYLVQNLGDAGHVVGHVTDGRGGFDLACRQQWDLFILDRMLPGLDGLGLVKAIRAAGIAAPILFLTALGELDERVAGLNAGADDYLGKPFARSELLARVGALGRRHSPTGPETILRIGDLHMDLIARKVRRGGRDIDLQPREFRLLEVLMRHSGQIVTRRMLLEQVWQLHFDPHTNIVESHISRVRAKIAQGGAGDLIHTVRGAGYSLHLAR